MKKKDWTYIFVIVIISGVLSYVLSTLIIGNRKTKPLQIEVVTKINNEFKAPENTADKKSKYFNENSLNLTKLIEIDGKGNDNPFSKTQ